VVTSKSNLKSLSIALQRLLVLFGVAMVLIAPLRSEGKPDEALKVKQKVVVVKKSKENKQQPSRDKASMEACRPLAWPLSRSLPLPAIQSEAEKFGSAQLVSFVWHELSERPQLSVAAPLLQILYRNEYDDALRQYFKGIGFLAYEGQDIESVLREWPRNREIKRSLPLEFLCQHFPRK
jgi:hypothetical protein